MADQKPLVFVGTAPNFTKLGQLQTADRLDGIVNESDFVDNAIYYKPTGLDPTNLVVGSNTLVGNIGAGVAALNANDLTDLVADVLNITAKGEIAVFDGSAFQVLSPGTNGQLISYNSATATGLEAIDAPAGGASDDLGDHIATQDLDLANFDLINVTQLVFGTEIDVQGTSWRALSATTDLSLSYSATNIITLEGDDERVRIFSLANTNDDSGVETPSNFIYTDTGGRLQTTFLSELGIPSTLNDLSNVSALAPSNGDVIQFNGTSWVTVALAGLTSDLGALQDVTVTAVPGGDDPQSHILVYEDQGGGFEWFSQALTIDLCQDVDTTGVADTNVLVYSGANSAWEAVALSTVQDNLGDHTATQTLDMDNNNISNVSNMTFRTVMSIGSPATQIVDDTIDGEIQFRQQPASDDTFTRFAIDYASGDLRAPAYDSARDDTGTTAISNVLYTNGTGVLLSAPVEDLPYHSTPKPVSAQTTGFTLAAKDSGTVYRLTADSAQSVAVDTNANVPMDVGSHFEFIKEGTGAITIDPEVGVTFVSPGGLTDFASQYSTIRIIKVATDTWVMSGDLA